MRPPLEDDTGLADASPTFGSRRRATHLDPGGRSPTEKGSLDANGLQVRGMMPSWEIARDGEEDALSEGSKGSLEVAGPESSRCEDRTCWALMAQAAPAVSCHETSIAAGLLSVAGSRQVGYAVGPGRGVGKYGQHLGQGNRQLAAPGGKCDMSVMCRCLVSQPGVWVAARWSLLWTAKVGTALLRSLAVRGTLAR